MPWATRLRQRPSEATCPNPIVAGVTNDVCTASPALTALDDGYRVQVVGELIPTGR
ncbi:hypothetical protein [Saccharopolyspora shandongensis]|uniref:hypothetical protein n=1 Tax=Saccharopolyspora shandongensis TaxID=418495 RepID=UPI0033C4E0DE